MAPDRPLVSGPACRGLAAHAIVLLAAASASCGGDSTDPSPTERVPSALVIVQGNEMTAQVGTVLPINPMVRVSDGQGPLSGIVVHFGTEYSVGALSATQVTTNSQGEASTVWTLPVRAGTWALDARVDGLPAVVFNATALPGPPDTLVGTPPYHGKVGGYFESRPYVAVLDRFRNGVPQIPVTFEVRSGGGSLEGSVVSSDSDGLAATPPWRLGPAPGTQAVIARIATGDSALLQVIGTPVAMFPIAGDSQRVKVGREVSGVTLKAVDANGNPFPGVELLAWSSPDAFFGANIQTDSQGVARVEGWRLPWVPGSYGLEIWDHHDTWAHFTATAYVPAAVRATVIAGAGQIGYVSNYLGPRPEVRFEDGDGEPVASLDVEWTASADGRVSKLRTTTDTLGVANTEGWRLGSIAGSQQLTAGVGTPAAVTIEATALPLPSPGFRIEARFPKALPTIDQAAAVAEAVARWEGIVLGDLPDVPLVTTDTTDQCVPLLNETVDDVLVFIHIEPIDGPGQILGGALPCVVREATLLPLVGAIVLDSADVATMAHELLRDVVAHELAHVLGFGTLWRLKGLLDGPEWLKAYTGVIARTAFHGLATPGDFFWQPTVPVDNSGIPGTQHAHWVESLFLNELMTPYADSQNPISAVTTAAMRDLGYITTDTAAETFSFMAYLRGGPASQVRIRELDLRHPLVEVDSHGRPVRRHLVR